MWIMIWISTLASILITAGHCTNQPEVRTPQGTIKGLFTKTIYNRQIASFEGIPYAKPPSRKHRFKAPVAAGLWYGVLNATRAPPPCLQPGGKGVSGSEDCLYINVYTPQLPVDSAENKLLDVIAFIHGGAFIAGESKTHGPYILLDRDVVLVTFNYRLGILGFLSTEDAVVPGNNGLKDQVLALKWIQQNIAFFGGNPRSVTLAGHSAGSCSVHFHVLSPLSKGLFKRAMIMSGVGLNPWSLAENSNEKAKIVANDLGCPTNDSLLMLNCLRNRPANHIVELSSKLQHPSHFPNVAVGPVIEPFGPDAFISESPIDIIKKKGGVDVPIMLSFVPEEGLIITSDIIINQQKFDAFLNGWEDILPHFLDFNYTVPISSRSQIIKNIKEYYKVNNNAEGKKALVKLASDRIFMAGISKVAKLSASLYTSPIYVYKFSYRGEFSLTDADTKDNLGVCHADDTYYTLGYSGRTGGVINTEKDLQVSKQMLDIWVSFAANGTLEENWEPVQRRLPQIVYTDIKGPDDLKLTLVDELGEEAFWDSLGLNENIESSNRSHTEL